MTLPPQQPPPPQATPPPRNSWVAVVITLINAVVKIVTNPWVILVGCVVYGILNPQQLYDLLKAMLNGVQFIWSG